MKCAETPQRQRWLRLQTILADEMVDAIESDQAYHDEVDGDNEVQQPRHDQDQDAGDNLDDQMREIEVTSYVELVLASQAADVMHPAFSKLFIETEHLAGLGAILATRRRRAPTEPEVWAAHLAVVDGVAAGKREFETDRARFLGRGGSIRAPGAVMGGRPLSCSTGAVLDPIFALRRRVRIAPGATARIDFWTMVASSR